MLPPHSCRSVPRGIVLRHGDVGQATLEHLPSVDLLFNSARRDEPIHNDRALLADPAKCGRAGYSTAMGVEIDF